MHKLEIFIKRLQKIGINIKLSNNYPWIYLDEINGVSVTETFHANHGFTIAFLPVKMGQVLQFTDIPVIFKLIRKYINNSY